MAFRYTIAMRIYLESLGCRLNYAEMASLGRQLVAAGHELAASAVEADLCVLNSCTVTGEAARQSRQLARQMARPRFLKSRKNSSSISMNSTPPTNNSQAANRWNRLKNSLRKKRLNSSIRMKRICNAWLKSSIQV